MGILRKALKFLDDRIEFILVGILLSVFTSLIFFEVCMRYLFGSPTDWAEELSRYLFIYMTYIAAALGVKRGAHIKVDIIRQRLSEKGQRMIDVFGHCSMIILSLVIMVSAIEVMKLQLEMEQLAQAWTLMKINFNMAYAYAALPISCVLIIIRSIQRIYLEIG